MVFPGSNGIEGAINQDGHKSEYRAQAITPRGTNYPPELVMGANKYPFHIRKGTENPFTYTKVSLNRLNTHMENN